MSIRVPQGSQRIPLTSYLIWFCPPEKFPCLTQDARCFKDKAVRQVIEHGYTVKEVAEHSGSGIRVLWQGRRRSAMRGIVDDE